MLATGLVAALVIVGAACAPEPVAPQGKCYLGTFVGDGYYSGSADTVGNFVTYPTSSDGTCSGNRHSEASTVVTADDALTARAKCVSLLALEQSTELGLSAFWPAAPRNLWYCLLPPVGLP